MRSATPATPAIAPLTSSAFSPQDVEVRAVDADDQRGAGPGEDLLDPLAEIGQQVAVEAGIAVDDGLDLGHRGVVVDLGIEADPELGEVGADDLVGHLGPADVGAEVAHAGDGPQLLAGPLGDADHGLERRARLLHPVHQEIVLLEMGQELLAQERDGGERQDEGAAEDEEHAAGPAR